MTKEFIVGKKCFITYKDSGKCSRLVDLGICLSYDAELIILRCSFTKRVEAISNSLIEHIEIQEVKG